MWRAGPEETRIAVVHRPRYDDWTLPKGKLRRGEGELPAAVREISEETGASVAAQRYLGRIRYDAQGVDKTVAYWAMRYIAGDFAPNDEVDALSWCSPAAAHELLTYDLDRTILDEFFSVTPADSLVLLVRHARAGRRTEWAADDDLRPLDASGEQQAAALVPMLQCFRPTRVLTAEPVRCRQTLAPLAAALEVPVELVPAFGDESYVGAPIAAEAALYGLGRRGSVTAVCSQGTTIPGLLSTVAPHLRSTQTRKGEFWALSFVEGKVVAAERYAPGA